MNSLLTTSSNIYDFLRQRKESSGISLLEITVSKKPKKYLWNSSCNTQDDEKFSFQIKENIQPVSLVCKLLGGQFIVKLSLKDKYQNIRNKRDALTAYSIFFKIIANRFFFLQTREK